MACRIGIISDTHRMLRPEALAALEGTDRIIHAGDIGSFAVIEALRGVAPVTAVRGNVDVGDWAREFPETAVVEPEGVRICVIHDLKDLDLDPCAMGFSAVVYGHSHAPLEETRNGVLYFNPGSAGPRRFHLPVSVGRLTIDAGRLFAEIVYLSG